MCDRWKWVRESNNATSSLSRERLDSLFEELADIGVQEILFSGGEPMMRPDFGNLVEKVSHLGMAVSFFTNGTQMNREIAEILAIANATVIFSIDGVSETHDRIRGVRGTFNRAIEGIQSLVEAKKNNKCKNEISVNFLVQRSNIQDMIPWFQLAERIGVDTVMYSPVVGKPNVLPTENELVTLKQNVQMLKGSGASSNTKVLVEDVLAALIEEQIPLEDIESGSPTLSLFRNNPVPCFAAYSGSFIDSFGRVFPCCYCYLDNNSFTRFEKEREQFYLGNILETDFKNIWYGKRYNEFRTNTSLIKADDKFSICGQCYNYFMFRKSYKKYLLYNRITTAFRPTPKERIQI